MTEYKENRIRVFFTCCLLAVYLTLSTIVVGSEKNSGKSEQTEKHNLDLTLTLSEMKVGHIPARYGHGIGTYLASAYYLKNVKRSTNFNNKTRPIIGAEFKMTSQEAKRLQLVSILVGVPQDDSELKVLDGKMETIKNGDKISHWFSLKGRKRAEFSRWGVQFILVAIDDGIKRKKMTEQTLRQGRLVYEAIFTAD